jgi:hypothetical protein
MCDTPPTLITVHFDLVQHFIEDTVLQRIIWNWSLLRYELPEMNCLRNTIGHGS